MSRAQIVAEASNAILEAFLEESGVHPSQHLASTVTMRIHAALMDAGTLPPVRRPVLVPAPVRQDPTPEECARIRAERIAEEGARNIEFFEAVQRRRAREEAALRAALAEMQGASRIARRVAAYRETGDASRGETANG